MNSTTSSYNFQAFIKLRMQLNWYLIFAMQHSEKTISSQLQKDGVELKLSLDLIMKFSEHLFLSFLLMQISLDECNKAQIAPLVQEYICFEGKAFYKPETKIVAMRYQHIIQNELEKEYIDLLKGGEDKDYG